MSIWIVLHILYFHSGWKRYLVTSSRKNSSLYLTQIFHVFKELICKSQVFSLLNCTKDNAIPSLHYLVQLIAMWHKTLKAKSKWKIGAQNSFTPIRKGRLSAHRLSQNSHPQNICLQKSAVPKLSNLDENLDSTEKSHLSPWVKYVLVTHICTKLISQLYQNRYIHTESSGGNSFTTVTKLVLSLNWFLRATHTESNTIWKPV